MCADENPCGFTCTNGFTAFPPSKPTMCACSAPKMVCNGKCMPPGACPSSGVITHPVKRRWAGSGSCAERPGWAACGVYGEDALAWECVNTARDLESCECACPRINTCHPFDYFRWRMRAPPDALLADRPRLHRYPRCCGRRLSLWEM